VSLCKRHVRSKTNYSDAENYRETIKTLGKLQKTTNICQNHTKTNKRKRKGDPPMRRGAEKGREGGAKADPPHTQNKKEGGGGDTNEARTRRQSTEPANNP
jgi:hypothetical protein